MILLIICELVTDGFTSRVLVRITFCISASVGMSNIAALAMFGNSKVQIPVASRFDDVLVASWSSFATTRFTNSEMLKMA